MVNLAADFFGAGPQVASNPEVLNAIIQAALDAIATLNIPGFDTNPNSVGLQDFGLLPTEPEPPAGNSSRRLDPWSGHLLPFDRQLQGTSDCTPMSPSSKGVSLKLGIMVPPGIDLAVFMEFVRNKMAGNIFESLRPLIASVSCVSPDDIQVEFYPAAAVVVPLGSARPSSIPPPPGPIIPIAASVSSAALLIAIGVGYFVWRMRYRVRLAKAVAEEVLDDQDDDDEDDKSSKHSGDTDGEHDGLDMALDETTTNVMAAADQLIAAAEHRRDDKGPSGRHHDDVIVDMSIATAS